MLRASVRGAVIITWLNLASAYVTEGTHVAHGRPTLKPHAPCVSSPHRAPRSRISNANRTASDVTLVFLHVAAGQQWDIITASPGGAVAFINSINARSACLPFDVALKQLQSLPVANPRSGVADP